jgi:hypothetical protein
MLLETVGWTEEHIKVVEDIKKAAANAVTLAHPNDGPEYETCVFTGLNHDHDPPGL